MDPDNYEVFADAMDRKMRLFDLFEELEHKERIRKKRRRPAAKRPYPELKQSMGTVVEIYSDSVLWRRRDGSTYKVNMTPEICGLLRVNDRLLMSLGKRQEDWRVIFVGAIVNASGETTVVQVET